LTRRERLRKNMNVTMRLHLVVKVVLLRRIPQLAEAEAEADEVAVVASVDEVADAAVVVDVVAVALVITTLIQPLRLQMVVPEMESGFQLRRTKRNNNSVIFT
jgi:hypothetical protein